jgi:hypothetical protein
MSSVIPIAIVVVAALLAFGAGALLARRRGYLKAGEVVARCGRGHLFTTTWNRPLSRKELSLGWTRLQRCPVGGHWTLARQVPDAELTPQERREAREHRDAAIG